jgi:hypothetical protein
MSKYICFTKLKYLIFINEKSSSVTTSSAIFHRRFRSSNQKDLDKELCHIAWYGSKYLRPCKDLLRQQWHYSTIKKQWHYISTTYLYYL